MLPVTSLEVAVVASVRDGLDTDKVAGFEAGPASDPANVALMGVPVWLAPSIS